MRPNLLNLSTDPNHVQEQYVLIYPLGIHREPLTYRWGESLSSPCIGQLVRITVRKKMYTGLVVDIHQPHPLRNVEPILSIVSEKPILDLVDLHFYKRLADYYHCSESVLLDQALPHTLLPTIPFLRIRATKQGHARVVLSTNDDTHRHDILFLQQWLSVKFKQCAIVHVALVETIYRLWKQELLEIDNLPFSKTSCSVDELYQHALTQNKISKKTPTNLRENKRSERHQQFNTLENISLIQPFSEPLELNTEQRNAVETIKKSINLNEYKTFLLHGVTGSGKTEIYIQNMLYTLQQGKNVLYLVPEISLTPLLIERLSQKISFPLYSLHSAMTLSQRRFVMNALLQSNSLSKTPFVLVGTRSTILKPIFSLGLIIVDEEHDSSYKQTEYPRIHARDVAVGRARANNIVCILGSATPSFESRLNASRGHYQTLSLKSRAPQYSTLPSIFTADMRGFDASKTLIHPSLHEDIEHALKKNEQVLLLLNRRGYSGSIHCTQCGHIDTCEHCSIALTYYKQKHLLQCHQCFFKKSFSNICQQCGHHEVTLVGIGTEQLEYTLAQYFPTSRIVRIDRDEITTYSQLEKIIHRIKNHDVDIIVGTQLLSKGHDFPFISVVGILQTDTALSIPDFRATEKAYAWLVQSSGRAGRAEIPGKVWIQTFQPEHPMIQSIQSQQNSEWIEQELSLRKVFMYPPYAHLALIRVEGPEHSFVENQIRKLAKCMLSNLQNEMNILGPAPCPTERLKNDYRWQILCKSPTRQSRARFLDQITNHPIWIQLHQNKKLRINLDIDPIFMD